MTQLTDEDLTRIYNEANGIDGKNPPITTMRIFAAMRAVAAQYEAKLATAREALEMCESAFDECRDYPITHDAVIEALTALGDAQPKIFKPTEERYVAMAFADDPQPASAEVKPVAWKSLPENPEERRGFDSSVSVFGDVRLAIAIALRTYGYCQPGGSFADQCFIMANEVAKLYTSPTPPQQPRQESEIAAEALEEAAKIADYELPATEEDYPRHWESYREAWSIRKLVAETIGGKIRALAAQKREAGK